MPLALQVVISGSVSEDVEQVLVDGFPVALTGRRYEVDVPVSRGVVTITAIDRAGREWTRTIQMNAVAGAAV